MGIRRKLNIVVDAEYKGNREIKKAADDIDTLDDNATKGNMSLGDLAKTGAAVGVALGAAAVAAQQAYKIIGEGAELTAAAGRFDNLAGSINTTSDALLNDLRKATSGMMSDAELIAGATDIINTGLGGTHDQTVRLATAVGTLGLDMQTTILTFANNSKARLDSLGLSISDVDKKTKELQATGMEYDQAFDEAVLVLLEEKMTLLGDASETTAGQMAILEADVVNLTNEAKILAATIAGPTISALASAATGQSKLNEGIEAGVITTREWNDIVNKAANLQEGNADAIDFVNRKLEEQRTGISAAEQTIIAYYQSFQEGERVTFDVTNATNKYIEAALDQERAMQLNHVVTEQQAAALEELAISQDVAMQAVEQAAATLGDYFTASLQTVGTSDELITSSEAQAAAIFSAADAAGASATELALLGLATGQLSEAQAEAALKSAALQEKITELGGAIAEGLDPAAALENLQAFQDTLNAQEFSVPLGVLIEDTPLRDTSDEAVNLAEKMLGVKEESLDTGIAIEEAATMGIDAFMPLTEEMITTQKEMQGVTSEADGIKNRLFALTENEHVIRVRIETTGSIPDAPGSGGAGGIPEGAATATDTSERLGG